MAMMYTSRWWCCQLLLLTAIWYSEASTTTAEVEIYPGVFHGPEEPSPELAYWSGIDSDDPQGIQLIPQENQPKKLVKRMSAILLRGPSWSSSEDSAEDLWSSGVNQQERGDTGDDRKERVWVLEGGRRAHRVPPINKDVWTLEEDRDQKRWHSGFEDDYILRPEIEVYPRERCRNCARTAVAGDFDGINKRVQLTRKRSEGRDQYGYHDPTDLLTDDDPLDIARSMSIQSQVIPVDLPPAGLHSSSYYGAPAKVLGQSLGATPSQADDTARRISVAAVLLRRRRIDTAHKQIRIHQCYFNPVSCFK